MSKLRTVLFRDGRPGHEKQSFGIISALRQYADLEVSEITVKPAALPRRMLYWLLFYLAPHRLSSKDMKADLLLGTGSSTHLHLLALKKIIGAKAVVCMKPSTLLVDHFDLCFVPFHDRMNPRENIFETIGPPNLSRISQSKDRGRALILVGGENRLTEKWDSAEMVKRIKSLVKKNDERQWTISTSPRTPQYLEEDIGRVFNGYKNVDYLPFKETRPGWVDQQYERNLTVWVTADSMSMVYEALSAGCRVGILPVSWKKQNNKFSYSIEYLESKNKVVTFDRYMTDAWQWKEGEILEEADKCAREIMRRWWPNDLR